MKKIIFICTLLVSLFAMSGCSDDIDTPVPVSYTHLTLPTNSRV